RAAKEKWDGLVLKPHDDGRRQRRGRRRRPQQVRIAEVEDEFHAAVGRDVLGPVGEIGGFVDPEAPDGIPQELVGDVLVVSHYLTPGPWNPSTGLPSAPSLSQAQRMPLASRW